MNRKTLALLIVGLMVSGVTFGWSTTGGDGTRFSQIRETAVFHNNSGATITQGMIVVIDTTASAASTLGSYVTTTSTADSSGVVGVVLDASCADGTACVVVTKGVADTLILDATDPVATGNVIGTSTTTGYGGRWGTTTGTVGKLGRALENGDGTDTGFVYVYVNPSD